MFSIISVFSFSTKSPSSLVLALRLLESTCKLLSVVFLSKCPFCVQCTRHLFDLFKWLPFISHIPTAKFKPLHTFNTILIITPDDNDNELEASLLLSVFPTVVSSTAALEIERHDKKYLNKSCTVRVLILSACSLAPLYFKWMPSLFYSPDSSQHISRCLSNLNASSCFCRLLDALRLYSCH